MGRVLLELLIGERGRRALEDDGARALADLPLFEHTDGSAWTLKAILRLHGEGESVYLRRAGTEDFENPPRITLLEAPNVASVLEPLVGTLEDLETAMRRRVAQEFNRSTAADMPKPPPDAVEVGHVWGRGAEGLIWIHPQLDESAVALGDEEKLVSFIDPSGIFIVGGALYGEAVTIDEAWETATLSRRAGQLLRKRAQELYGVVQERFDPLARDRDRSWYRDRTVLRQLLVRMHEKWEGGQKSSKGPARRMYKALRKLPLFELPNERMVTLEQYETFHTPEPSPSPSHPSGLHLSLSPRPPSKP